MTDEDHSATAFHAGLDGVTFTSHGSRLLGGFYTAAGATPRPTAILLHGLPGVEKSLDVAYALRDLGWNCLYFHYRGCWGSDGVYSLTHLADDTRAAVEWTLRQPSVDATRLVLIGGSAGGHAALTYAAADPRIRATVALCPAIDPRTFAFPAALADDFASMLSGITGDELRAQWQALPSVVDVAPALASRPVLMVTADRDELFPPAHYASIGAALPGLSWARAADADHAFSTCRPWLVRTVTEWLVSTLGV